MEARTRLEARVTLARQWHRSVVAAACRHNAAVAAQCNEPELANCWRTLQALSNDPSPTSRLLHHGGGGSQPSSGHPTPTSSLPQPQFQQLRVRFHIIRNACIENVGKSQSCMVSKLRIIWKQTVRQQGPQSSSREIIGKDATIRAFENAAGRPLKCVDAD